MNYKEMSDFEINKLVAEKLGLNVLSIEPYCYEDEDIDGNRFLKLHGGGSTVQVLHSCKGWLKSYRYFDYCNNPSDSWPIILENRINIKHLPISDAWTAEESKDICVYSIDKNPLRASMIVYLMMGEGDELHKS